MPAPLLLLGNSIGTSATALWAASAAFLGERFHVVAWDLPGHGRNTDPVSEGFSMAELAAGVMAFAERVLDRPRRAGWPAVLRGRLARWRSRAPGTVGCA